MWVDDDRFDLDFHLRRSAVPSPGGRLQLERSVGRVLSRPLDRSKPLWELYVFEGVDAGRTAVLLKLHHALADGIGSMLIGSALFDLEADAPLGAPPAAPWRPEPIPPRDDLVHAAFEEMTTERWRRVTTVNLDAVFWTFREAAKHMVARAKAGDPGGSLVVTSSTSAIHGAPRNQAYASTKGAVLSMVRGLAVEYARYGIRANSILPGWIATDMTAGLQKWDTFNEKAIGRVPMRRWGEGDDFSGIAVYLASDASKFHTGDSFVIDGGYTIF